MRDVVLASRIEREMGKKHLGSGRRVYMHFSHMRIMRMHMRNQPDFMRMFVELCGLYQHIRRFFERICATVLNTSCSWKLYCEQYQAKKTR